MKSSSSDLALPELRSGVWTRFGSNAVLGDAVTEDTLASLAESTRTAARSQGYAVGWAEGQRAARALAAVEAEAAAEARRAAAVLRDEEHRAAIAALAVAASHLHDQVAGTCARVEERASDLAYDLLVELVGHQVAVGVDVVRRALALLPPEPLVTVRLHPDELAGSEALAAAGATVIADPALNRGDALVEAAEHVLDLRISTALERVREVLR
ncbi:hypothetical protein EFK50_12940 [Nocardioides marmoriginsengisoli]|uniref:Flagellar assembly protein FliH/Type III secretion system HrpE domain-containing protein n=1 Tax=Nocardioides marmoriginsengisoli TaxID=661483 RepID=A0A3N0CGU3_9ACTN|nr:FliH/SctL family protein [Nocardioides marmoriginsengisoli]RNL62657.1 hypothetical protein EFK50_12940 [Nocardioides marmoriginsengisoli]